MRCTVRKCGGKPGKPGAAGDFVATGFNQKGDDLFDVKNPFRVARFEIFGLKLSIDLGTLGLFLFCNALQLVF